VVKSVAIHTSPWYAWQRLADVALQTRHPEDIAAAYRAFCVAAKFTDTMSDSERHVTYAIENT